MGLSVIETTLTLRMLDRGPSRVWLGPALRGAIGWQWKSQACRFPHEQQRTRWRWCGGCPHLGECSYGRTLEPEFPPDEHGRPWHNQPRATPRLVLAPRFPTPEVFAPGEVLAVTLKLIGRHAEADLADLLEAIGRAGTSRGLGDGGTPFRLVDRGDIRRIELDPAALPRSASAGTPAEEPGVRLAVHLHTPLLLRGSVIPTLGDLFQAARMAVTQVMALEGIRLEVDAPALRAAAERAERTAHDFQRFEWDRKSNRTGDRWRHRGVVGWGVFERVPWCVVPWLRWGGLLQMGQDRGRGAGAMSLAVG